jgi:hypothetical protein
MRGSIMTPRFSWLDSCSFSNQWFPEQAFGLLPFGFEELVWISACGFSSNL